MTTSDCNINNRADTPAVSSSGVYIWLAMRRVHNCLMSPSFLLCTQRRLNGKALKSIIALKRHWHSPSKYMRTHFKDDPSTANNAMISPMHVLPPKPLVDKLISFELRGNVEFSIF